MHISIVFRRNEDTVNYLEIYFFEEVLSQIRYWKLWSL